MFTFLEWLRQRVLVETRKKKRRCSACKIEFNVEGEPTMMCNKCKGSK